MVSRAFQEMMSGRRGPVSLEMPWDVFTQRAEVGPAKAFDSLPAPQPDPDRIKAAAALITDSKRPMIFVGSGAIHAREEILELAEMIDAPVVAFRSGRGIVSNAHELGLTMAAAYRLWPNTDLMIGIGTRLELPTHVALAISSGRPEIGSYRHRSRGDAAVHARYGRDRGCAAPARRSGRGSEKGRLQQDQRSARRDPRGDGGGAQEIRGECSRRWRISTICARCCPAWHRRRRAVAGRICLAVRLSGL